MSLPIENNELRGGMIASEGQVYTHFGNYPMQPDQQSARELTPAPKREVIRDINIHAVDRGFVVSVGCQTIAIESLSKLVGLLTEYLHHPSKTEEKYYAGTLI